MLLLSVLVCFSTLLQASLSTPGGHSLCRSTSLISFIQDSRSTPIWATKPKPVDLEYSCTSVLDPTQQDFSFDDVPVILLHGLTGNKETWHGIFELIALDTKKKVCVADLRNHGESPWNDKEYDVIAMTEDVIHLLDQMKASKAIVLGHSLGGQIAVRLALNYPERVEKIIVEDMRPNGVPPEAMSGVKMYVRLLKELEKHIPQGVSEKEAKQKVLEVMKDEFAKMNITYDRDDLAYVPIKCTDGKCKLSTNPVLLDSVLRNNDELLNESSVRFNGPALFIYGAESPFKVGEDESNIKKMFPNVELVEVEGADHIVHNSKKFVREVVKFINK